LIVGIIKKSPRTSQGSSRHRHCGLSGSLFTMVFLHLFIVNKSGGLIHHRRLSEKAPKIGTNEWLRIGSTFHSLHAIAAEASPVRLPNGKNSSGADDGIERIVAGGMELRCLQTLTGIKFVITSERGMTVDIDSVLKEIYVLYAECVCKDPFYELEMPIRSELFSQAVENLIEKVEKTGHTLMSKHR